MCTCGTWGGGVCVLDISLPPTRRYPDSQFDFCVTSGKTKVKNMLKIICLVTLYVVSVNTLCVRQSREHVFCRNEFRFRQMFRTATNLDIVDSVLPPNRLVMFPSVKQISVKGMFRIENCNSLRATGIKLIGCDGNYMTNCLVFSVVSEQLLGIYDMIYLSDESATTLSTKVSTHETTTPEHTTTTSSQKHSTYDAGLVTPLLFTTKADALDQPTQRPVTSRKCLFMIILIR